MSLPEWNRLAAKAGLALLFAPRYYAFLTGGTGLAEVPHKGGEGTRPVRVPD
jgi:hypothetical protein